MIDAVQNSQTGTQNAQLDEKIKKEVFIETDKTASMKCILVLALPNGTDFIFEGEVFSSENIEAKRSGSGISPMEWDYVIGKKAKRNFSQDEIISL